MNSRLVNRHGSIFDITGPVGQYMVVARVRRGDPIAPLTVAGPCKTLPTAKHYAVNAANQWLAEARGPQPSGMRVAERRRYRAAGRGSTRFLRDADGHLAIQLGHGLNDRAQITLEGHGARVRWQWIDCHCRDAREVLRALRMFRYDIRSARAQHV